MQETSVLESKLSRSLLALADEQNRSCQEVIVIAEDNLGAVRSRIIRLRALEKELS
jgi:hypothetical protein